MRDVWRLTRLVLLSQFVAAFVLPAGPAHADPPVVPLETGGCNLANLQAWLGCVQARLPVAGTAIPAVTVPANLPVDNSPLDPGAVQAVHDAGLVATVPDKQTTGRGGTILFIIAADRKVGPKSHITTIEQSDFDALSKMGPGFCPPVKSAEAGIDTLCGLLTKGGKHPRPDLSGQEVVDAEGAQSSGGAVAAPPVQAPGPDQGTAQRQDEFRQPAEGGPGWLTWPMVILGFVVMVLAVVWAAASPWDVLRRSVSFVRKWRSRRRARREEAAERQAQQPQQPQALPESFGTGQGQRPPESIPPKDQPRELGLGPGMYPPPLPGPAPRPPEDLPPPRDTSRLDLPGQREVPPAAASQVRPTGRPEPSRQVSGPPADQGEFEVYSRTPRPPAVRPGSEETVLDALDGRRMGNAVIPAGWGSRPREQAIVATSLGPQGYVELDGLFYRARWMENGPTAPGPGGTVWVTEQVEETGFRWAYREREQTAPGGDR